MTPIIPSSAPRWSRRLHANVHSSRYEHTGCPHRRTLVNGDLARREQRAVAGPPTAARCRHVAEIARCPVHHATCRTGAGAATCTRSVRSRPSSSITRRPDGVKSHALSRLEPLRGVTFAINPRWASRRSRCEICPSSRTPAAAAISRLLDCGARAIAPNTNEVRRVTGIGVRPAASARSTPTQEAGPGPARRAAAPRWRPPALDRRPR